MRYLFFFLLFVFGASACTAFKDPVFHGISKWSLDRIENGKPVLAIQLDYFNPNGKGGVLRDARGEAWLEGEYLGQFSLDGIVNVPGKAAFTVPVLVALDPKNLLSNSIPLLLKEEVKLRITGTAKVQRGGFSKTIPLRYEGAYEVHELLK